MDIIGNGFIARHLEPLRHRHHGVTVLAAGVPRQGLPPSELAREADLVRATSDRARQRGSLLVFFSTASMYGTPGCRGTEDEPIEPSTRYGAHKLDLERVVRESGAAHLILRLAYVLGPHGPDFRLLPALIRQLRAGRIRIEQGARRDMVYVDDYVRVFDALLDTGVRDQVVNLASGDCVEVGRIVDHLEAKLDIRAERDIVSGSVSHCPSVAKLNGLLPHLTAATFGEGYHRTAIDRYLRATAAADLTA
ncbi:SDR family oxidoreductase [Micromonospora ureilytica]|uniref:NAD-dependent epimerase/dehydratase family protein n=1 Tax=Micromonospora ureilytica TaxID=709868 RepID=UPI0033DC05A5